MVEYQRDVALQPVRSQAVSKMNPYLQVLGFLVIVRYLKCTRTFVILFAASLINMVFYWVTTEVSPLLVFGYSSIDTLTAILILKYGDSQKLYQSSLLFVAVGVHYMMQVDLITGSNTVYDKYIDINTRITILQMIGACFDGFHQLLRDVWGSNSNRVKRPTIKR